MPVYDYECPHCKKTTEVVRKMSDTSKVFCKCGTVMQRLISRTHFVLRGGGWAKDGYAPPKPKEKKS